MSRLLSGFFVVLCAVVIAVWPGAARANHLQTFLGWSADYTAYGYLDFNDGDLVEDVLLCRSDPATPSPTWPKGVPQPPRGAACTGLPCDDSGICSGGKRRKKLLAPYLVKPTASKTGPHGESLTLKETPDHYIVTAGTRTFELTIDDLQVGDHAQVEDIWWRPDGGAVAYLLVKHGAFVMMHSLLGSDPMSPARQTAKAANGRAMQRYKAKDWPGAVRELRAAIAADAAWPMPHYNLACVASMQADLPTVVGELEWLSRSTDPAARARLKKAEVDPDLAWARNDPKVRALLGPAPTPVVAPAAAAPAASAAVGSALTRRLGLPLAAWSDRPTEVFEGENNDCRELKSFALRHGTTRIDASYDDGVNLRTGKAPAAVYHGEVCLLGVGLGQLVPDEELEVVVHRLVQVGRGAYAQQIVILKRDGGSLAEIFVGELGEGAHRDNLAFDADGSIRYDDPDTKRTQRLHWSPAKRKFAP